MPERSVAVPAAEYRRRAAALHRDIAADGPDAPLPTTPPDAVYLSGIAARDRESPARSRFVIPPARGKPVAVMPAIGADLTRRTSIGDTRTWPAPVSVDDGVGPFVDTLCALTPETPRPLSSRCRPERSELPA